METQCILDFSQNIWHVYKINDNGITFVKFWSQWSTSLQKFPEIKSKSVAGICILRSGLCCVVCRVKWRAEWEKQRSWWREAWKETTRRMTLLTFGGSETSPSPSRVRKASLPIPTPWKSYCSPNTPTFFFQLNSHFFVYKNWTTRIIHAQIADYYR